VTGPVARVSPWNRIHLLRGDITKVECDAIVNAANTSLLGGGGVDGAIHRAAGPSLLAECRGLGGCPTGEARITRGYQLPAKHVIHTVGPVYRDGQHGEPEKLRSCYENSFRLAVTHGISTMAFPAISCGIYGYPLENAAEIALTTTAAFLASNESFQQAVFVLFSGEDLAVYSDVAEQLAKEPI
jgi:O-acetyl-ADP-ribose deacetylase (regulator of RNase III)